jgi:hypothetical protein
MYPYPAQQQRRNLHNKKKVKKEKKVVDGEYKKDKVGLIF